jgi:hypothetical protein
MKICRICNVAKKEDEFRKYRNQCRACGNEAGRKWKKEWYENNKKESYLRSVKYKVEHRQRVRELACLSNNKKRLAIIAFLGDSCVKCGFSDWRALQIDHVNGGGVKEYKEIKRCTSIFYKRIKSHKEKYQLLCANCNWIKRYENNENFVRLSA